MISVVLIIFFLGLFYFGYIGFSLWHRVFSKCGMQAYLPWGTWDLSFLTRDQTQVLCMGRWIPNHWTTGKSPNNLLYSSSLPPGSATNPECHNPFNFRVFLVPLIYKGSSVFTSHDLDILKYKPVNLQEAPQLGIAWRFLMYNPFRLYIFFGYKCPRSNESSLCLITVHMKWTYLAVSDVNILTQWWSDIKEIVLH